jgi:hypothetical protein
MKNHGAFGFIKLMRRLDFNDVGSLRAFLSVGYVKADLLAFFQSLETFILDCGKMDKYVGTILLLDKAETLAVVEPLYCTF